MSFLSLTSQTTLVRAGPGRGCQLIWIDYTLMQVPCLLPTAALPESANKSEMQYISSMKEKNSEVAKIKSM